MRTLVLACALVMSLAPRGLAAPTAEEVRKIIAERCAKVDHFSMECAVYSIRKGARSAGEDGLHYEFDRPTKRLLVAAGGDPVLFVSDARAFFLLDGETLNAPTYLEINRDYAIAWKDIAGALRIMKRECEPYGFAHFCAYEAYSEISTCFLAPFLDGGIDDLFSQDVQPLPYDAKSLAAVSADPEKVKQHLRRLMTTEKLSDIEAAIFIAGHPDSKLIASYTGTPSPLALDKFPLCFKIKNDSSSLAYAFNRKSGTFVAVTGTIDHSKVFSLSGNELTIIAKSYVIKDGDADKPLPLELPNNAKIIGVAGLKSAYLKILSETSLEEALKEKASEEEQLQKLIHEESNLSAKLARLSADAKADHKTLEEVRSQLALTRGDKSTFSNGVAKLQKLIATIERLKESKPSRKEGASAKKGE